MNKIKKKEKIYFSFILAAILLITGLSAYKMNEVKAENKSTSETTDTIAITENKTLNTDDNSQRYTVSDLKENKSDMWLVGYDYGSKPIDEEIPETVETSDYVNKYKKMIKERGMGNFPLKSEIGLEEFIYYYIAIDEDSENIKDEFLSCVIEDNQKLSKREFGWDWKTVLNESCFPKCDNYMSSLGIGDCSILDVKGLESRYNMFMVAVEMNSTLSSINNSIRETIQTKETEFLKGYNMGIANTKYLNFNTTISIIIPGWEHAADYTKDSAPVNLYGINSDGQYNSDYQSMVEELNNTYYNGGSYFTSSKKESSSDIQLLNSIKSTMAGTKRFDVFSGTTYDQFESCFNEQISGYLEHYPELKNDAINSSEMTQKQLDYHKFLNTYLKLGFSSFEKDYKNNENVICHDDFYNSQTGKYNETAYKAAIKKYMGSSTIEKMEQINYFEAFFSVHGSSDFREAYIEEYGEETTMSDMRISEFRNIITQYAKEYGIEDFIKKIMPVFYKNTTGESYADVVANDEYAYSNLSTCYNQDFVKAFYTGFYSGMNNAEITIALCEKGKLDSQKYNLVTAVKTDYDESMMTRLLDMSENASYWYKLGWSEGKK